MVQCGLRLGLGSGVDHYSSGGLCQSSEGVGIEGYLTPFRVGVRIRVSVRVSVRVKRGQSYPFTLNLYSQRHPDPDP